MNDKALPSLCECRDEVHAPHFGRTSFVRIDINTQPPGHGSYTVPAKVRLCENHARWFLDGHLNAWVKA